jgi:hypothetical protein
VKLAHDVVAVAYDRAHDRVVIASASPSNAVYVFDPATETEQRVDLPAGPPRSVAVSPDGLVAAVGRTGGITSVDLGARTAVDCPLTWTDTTAIPASTYPYDAAYVAVGSPIGGGKGGQTASRWAYAAPGDALNRGDFIASVNLSSAPCGGNLAASGWWVDYWVDENPIALRPGLAQLYHLDWYSNPYLDIFSTATGALASRVQALAGYDSGRDFWFLDDGARFLVASGDVFAADPVYDATGWGWELNRVGRLGNPGPYGTTHPAKHATSSTAADRITIVPAPSWNVGTEDEHIEAWSASTYDLVATTTLIPIADVSGSWPAKGLAVFYRSDALRRYVVARTPDMARAIFTIQAFPP